jgi:Zn-dependent peptidase ImmA (M78 family)/transcriptional regulator with XRE-family HTH domain
VAPEAPRAHGDRLTVLRHIHRLTQAGLAERLGSTQSFLSHVEKGDRPIPESLVVRASREFNLPATFFTTRPDAAGMGHATFRKSSRASARDGNRVEALYDEAARLFRRVSAASGYHTADLPDPADHQHDPELVAAAMRRAAGLSADDPVLNATRMLERFGIGVVDNLDHLDEASTAHTGISRPSRFNDRPLVALVVATLPGAVKRMTLLHEASHLIFDHELPAPIASTRSPEEKRAFQFAGAMLLPKKIVRARVSETLNLHGYLPIKADYGISVSAIIIRARDLGIISPQRTRSLLIQASSQGWRTNEPVPVAEEKPLLLTQALKKVYGRQLTAKASHDIGTSPDWINEWAHVHAEIKRSEPGKVISLADRIRDGRSGARHIS